MDTMSPELTHEVDLIQHHRSFLQRRNSIGLLVEGILDLGHDSQITIVDGSSPDRAGELGSSPAIEHAPPTAQK